MRKQTEKQKKKNYESTKASQQNKKTLLFSLISQSINILDISIVLITKMFVYNLTFVP